MSGLLCLRVFFDRCYDNGILILGILLISLMPGFFFSAISILSHSSTNEGRIDTKSLAFLVIGISMLAILGLWVTILCNANHLPDLAVAALLSATLSLPIGWCLCWSLDVVRRQQPPPLHPPPDPLES